MANRKFLLGMLVMVLALGMTLVGCEEEDKGDDDGDGNNFKEVGVIIIQSSLTDGQAFQVTLTGSGLKWKNDVDSETSLYSDLMSGDGTLKFVGGSLNDGNVSGTYTYFMTIRESDTRVIFKVINGTVDGTQYFTKIVGTVSSKNDNRTLDEFTGYIDGLEAYRAGDWLRITGDATLK